MKLIERILMNFVRKDRWVGIRASIPRLAVAASVGVVVFASASAGEAAAGKAAPPPVRGATQLRHDAVAKAAAQPLAQQLTISLVSSINGTGHFNYVYLQGSYAYIATGTNFIIYNVSNPATPVQVSSTPYTGGFSGVSVQGHFAYMSSYNTNVMTVWDVTNPAQPALLSTTTTDKQPYDIYAVGSTAYVTNLGGKSLEVFDASNPSLPALTSRSYAPRPDYVWTVGNYAYVANRSAGPTAGGGVSIFDVSQSTPLELSTIQLGSPIFSVASYGTYLYATSMNSGMIYVIDASNPAAPVLVNTIDTHVMISGKLANPGPWDVRVQGTMAYVAMSKKDWVVVYDLTDPVHPVQVGLAKTYAGISPQYLDVSGSYIYVADWGSDAMQIFKVGSTSSASSSQFSFRALLAGG